MDEDAAKNVHDDHRKRVRERFLKSGLDGFPEHNVLEFLLFYALPYGDTNETAHRLLNAFGSLSAVLDAPFEELIKVKGIGDYVATFICLMPQLAKRYFSGKVPDKVCISDNKALCDFAKSEFINETNEIVLLLCFNNAGVLLNCCKVSLGSKNNVHIDKRTLLETAFRNNATSVILAHNHPNGIAVPSSNDIATTREIFKVFDDIGIKMTDHIIVAGDDVFSMASNPKYCIYFI